LPQLKEGGTRGGEGEGVNFGEESRSAARWGKKGTHDESIKKARKFTVHRKAEETKETRKGRETVHQKRGKQL